ncbi:cellulose synthase BcsB subunit [Pseudorhizobium endolithicum]|uniref:Cyclic di-GMP-binding protein n=1 Tax=Pseudorhizobium endolithicum TaxID=1191678 RepID=A0ABN7JYR3_9HYPH|nr:cellulose biosynthesis cyclic di-GMP-binding regulatory protein BcsB [Pseudorhizobium endolithicum]CAD7049938.1 cellulose synthase BcsB subunit [Pseudorhizobium endolithicum]
MTQLVISCLLAIFLLGQFEIERAEAQPAPFDMSPERPRQEAPAPQLPRPRVVPSERPQPAPSPDNPAADAGAEEPAVTAQPEPHVTTPGSNKPEKRAAAAEASGPARRFVIPAASLTLTGEYARSSWAVYLTAEQAQAGRSFTLSYQNAIVVAPEASSLSLFVNNRRIGDEKISATNGVKAVTWMIPPSLLRPGSNDFDLVVNQRHRTDCDIRSTYDLWTEVDGAGTYIEFGPELKTTTSAIEAVQAFGADAEGRTRFQMIVPSVGALEQVAPLLRLSQALAVMSGMPNPQFSFQRQIENGAPSTAQMTVAIGTAADLGKILPKLPPGAEAGPVTSVMSSTDGAGPMIVVTGPTWSDVSRAIDTFIAPVLRPVTVRRESLTTDRWHRPNARFVFGGEMLSLAELGVPSIEFSGRRFRSSFTIALPSDFYAGAYGEAVLYLDAAYSAAVAGGTHIDIYVNGDIASTVPITEEGGGVFRQAPIRITMRHLRPGSNRIEIEAVLISDADAICAPASNASSEPRFALFDSSSFHMPRYARLGQTPNLAGLSGTGFPYSRQEQPTALFMDRIREETLTAAANILGKMAQVAGAPIVIEPVSAANAIGARNAIFIAPAAHIPPNVLTQLNLDQNLASTWRQTDSTDLSRDDNAATLDDWRERVEGGPVIRRIEAIRAWLREKLDFTEGALRFLPGREAPFSPEAQDELLLAQGPALNGTGIWTVLTAPESSELAAATGELVRQDLWQQVEGRAFTYSRTSNEVRAIEARNLSFLAPVDTSLSNYRLVAANWLSSNLLSYATAIVILSCLLGLTTAGLLRWLGRQE